MLDGIVAACLGIGLAAACGFRVFVPMFVIGVAAKSGMLSLGDGFHWVGSWPALATFGLATVLEIGAYHVPWLDNALDSVAIPGATIAGAVVSAACIVDLDPLLKWALAIIAGGGAAGTIKAGLAGFRLGSTATSGGIANPGIAAFESMMSLALSVIAILWPIVAAILTIVLLTFLIRFVFSVYRRFMGRSEMS